MRLLRGIHIRLILNEGETSEDEVECNLDCATSELEAAGFEILESYEDIILTRIFNVGAIVYYLKAIPFEIPDFTIKKYYSKLVEINKLINDTGYLDLDMNNHRFLIKAKKPKT